MGRDELLFSKGNLSDELDTLAAKAEASIMRLNADQLDPENEDALLEHLKREFVVNALQLHRDRMTREGPRDVEIELRGHQAFEYGEDHVTVRGIEVTFIVPFEGHPWLFLCRPSSWTSVFPGGIITGQEYRLTLRDPEMNAERFARNRDAQLQQVEDYIRRQADQIQSYNEGILHLIDDTIAKRRTELAAFANAFDVPEHVAQETPALSTPTAGARNTRKHMKKPSVFICYASKDAAAANDIFDRLTAAGADPWLDKRKLVLGDDWQHEIKKAVLEADAFVACLSPGFDQIGFRQKEVRWALDALELRPFGKGFLIPFILEPCDLPEWSKRFHAGDISKSTTFEELIRAVEKHCDWTRALEGV